MRTQQIAESFSGHRFAETYDHLADDVRWVLPGHEAIAGKDAVVAACEETSAELAGTSTELTRFVSVGGEVVAACDAVSRYTASDGAVTVVSSADIYEFDTHGRVTTITSYAVEIETD